MIHVCADERSVRRTRSRPWKSPRPGSLSEAKSAGTGQNKGDFSLRAAPGNGTPWEKKSRRAKAVTAKRVSAVGPEFKFMFERMSGASEGRGAIRGKARGPAVGAKRRLPGPGKTKVASAGGVEGAPAGRTGAGVNRPTRRREARPQGRLQPRGRVGEYGGGGGAQSR